MTDRRRGDGRSLPRAADDDPETPRHRRSADETADRIYSAVIRPGPIPTDPLPQPEETLAQTSPPPQIPASLAGTVATGSTQAPDVPPAAGAAPTPNVTPGSDIAHPDIPSVAAAASTYARVPATAQAQVRAQSAAASAATVRPPAARVHRSARPAAAVAEPVAGPPEPGRPEAELPPRAPGRPYLPRTPGTLFGLHAGQIVSWQVAVLAVLLVLEQPQWALNTVAGIALLLLILTVIPVQGRWLFQWLALWIRYTSRRRRWTIPHTEEGAFDVLLKAVTRGGELESLEIDGTSVALIRHAGGLTAVLAPIPSDSGSIVESAQLLPPLTELLPPGDEGEPVVSAQFVVHCIPGPSMSVESTAAASSYRQLGSGTVPSRRQCWVALQALHTADDHTDDVLCAALTSAVRRVQRRLRKAGMRAQPLNQDAAVGDFLALARLDAIPRGDEHRGAVIHEHWRSWSAAAEVQTTFRLLDWPDLSTPHTRNFLDWLAAVPTLATTVAVAARRNGEELELEAAVRMTLPDSKAVRPATRQAREVVGRAGARMQRLDGEQVFGVAASLPLGGFLS